MNLFSIIVCFLLESGHFIFKNRLTILYNITGGIKYYPWGRNTHSSILAGEFHGQRSLGSESDMTEQLILLLFTKYYDEYSFSIPLLISLHWLLITLVILFFPLKNVNLFAEVTISWFSSFCRPLSHILKHFI